jgi:hypothetical protein
MRVTAVGSVCTANGAQGHEIHETGARPFASFASFRGFVFQSPCRNTKHPCPYVAFAIQRFERYNYATNQAREQ